MNRISVLDRPQSHDGDAAVTTVAGLSTVGRLADDVLSDILKADAGIAPLADSVAMRLAAEAFKAAAAAVQAPVRIWNRSDLADALRRMAPGSTDSRSVARDDSSQDEWAERLNEIASALEATASGNESPDQRRLVVSEFESMAQGTLNAAWSTVHSQAYSSTWLTT
jgi:poly(3-hydroxybutyrate) depolymerase